MVSILLHRCADAVVESPSNQNLRPIYSSPTPPHRARVRYLPLLACIEMSGATRRVPFPQDCEYGLYSWAFGFGRRLAIGDIISAIAKVCAVLDT